MKKLIVLFTVLFSVNAMADTVELRDPSLAEAVISSGTFYIKYNKKNIYNHWYSNDTTSKNNLSVLKFNNFLEDAKNLGVSIFMDSSIDPLDDNFLKLGEQASTTSSFYTEFLEFKDEVNERLDKIETK